MILFSYCQNRFDIKCKVNEFYLGFISYCILTYKHSFTHLFPLNPLQMGTNMKIFHLSKAIYCATRVNNCVMSSGLKETFLCLRKWPWWCHWGYLGLGLDYLCRCLTESCIINKGKWCGHLPGRVSNETYYCIMWIVVLFIGTKS